MVGQLGVVRFDGFEQEVGRLAEERVDAEGKGGEVGVQGPRLGARDF